MTISSSVESSDSLEALKSILSDAGGFPHQILHLHAGGRGQRSRLNLSGSGLEDRHQHHDDRSQREESRAVAVREQRAPDVERGAGHPGVDETSQPGWRHCVSRPQRHLGKQTGIGV